MHDKLLDHEYLTDQEVLTLMADLSDTARVTSKLGRAFYLVGQSVAHTWYALALMAAARGLKFTPFAK